MSDVSSREKLPKLPDKLQFVFDKMMKIPSNLKTIRDVSSVVSDRPITDTIKDNLDLREEVSISPSRNTLDYKNTGNSISRSSNYTLDDKDICPDSTSDERSESTIRERLAVDMDFECQNDLYCSFEDDNVLQRAVSLRNRAFHSQATTPPPSPDQIFRICSRVSDHQNMAEFQTESAEFDECSEPSHGASIMEQLKPPLCDIERLIDQSFVCIRDKFTGEQLEVDCGIRDAKLSKSVRFADLPPRRKREISRSKSDPTTESSKLPAAQSSAEWNECFLVAVGENRAIRKEVRTCNPQHQQHACKQPEFDDNEYDDDDLRTGIDRTRNETLYTLVTS